MLWKNRAQDAGEVYFDWTFIGISFTAARAFLLLKDPVDWKSIKVLLQARVKLEKSSEKSRGLFYKNRWRFSKLSNTCTVFFFWITTFLFSSLGNEVDSGVITLIYLTFIVRWDIWDFSLLRFMKFPFCLEFNTHRPQKDVPLGWQHRCCWCLGLLYQIWQEITKKINCGRSGWAGMGRINKIAVWISGFPLRLILFLR